jgi:phage regulator Rha-like protein
MNGLINLKSDGFNWTSRDVAEWTGKFHHHVLRDIEDEISKLGKKLAQTIFGLSEYKEE